MTVQGFSDNFAKMADAGRVRDTDASTQFALIYADGNRVGAFLHEALAQPGGKIDKRDIVHVIDNATVGALADAVMNRFSGWGRPPVLANLAGGDDLLVSVSAADAWLFTRTLLASFGRLLGEGSQGWPETVRRKRPSLSAGVVFHHKMHPFSDLVRLAGQELRRAKAAGQGEQAMVSFLDLTADGGQPPEYRAPISLGYLDQYAGELERAEEIPPSRRQALLALLRRDAVDDVIRRVTDLDNQPLWDVIAGPGATADMARKKLAEEEGKLSELWQVLDIARHWRTRPRQEDAA
jgi:Cas10/Cmr2, second palm domain